MKKNKKKDIIITGYAMDKFYAAGIFQTTLAYATAFKKMGHNVKILLRDSDKAGDYKEDIKKKLVWLGIEYINTAELLKMKKVDYIIYMGFIYNDKNSGGNGLWEAMRDKFKKAKFVYAAFYNVVSGLVAGLTREEGYLSVDFKELNNFAFEEMWVLESHMKGSRHLLAQTFGSVKEMPLLVLEKDDYIEEYYNNKTPPITVQDFKFDVETCSKQKLLNLDPHSRIKHGFVPIIGALDWIRKEEGRQMVIGNAFPIWVNADGHTDDKVHEYFKKYMSRTLTPEENYNVLTQVPETIIKFYSRHPIHEIMRVSEAFAVIICGIGEWERWNVLLMDLFKFGVPVIHNFRDIDVGWKYEFPDTEGVNDAIEQCYSDLFENGKYEEYKAQARKCFDELSTIDSNKKKLEALIP